MNADIVGGLRHGGIPAATVAVDGVETCSGLVLHFDLQA
jgi:hypothetical protein